MPDQNDPLSSLASAIYKPIQQSEPTFNPRPVQPSGWEGKTGQIANLATNFLAGVSKGRAQAYDREQQNHLENLNNLKIGLAQIDASDASDDVKKQLRNKIMGVYGRLTQQALEDHGSTKGKKGGDPVFDETGNVEAQQPDKGHPTLMAMKGMLDSMLGPLPKKYQATPKDIQAVLGEVTATLKTAESQGSVQQKAEQSLSAAIGEAVKANGGKPLTSAQLQQNQALNNAIAQYNRITGGKPGPTLQNFGASLDQADKLAAEAPKTDAEIGEKKAQSAYYTAETRKAELEAEAIQKGTIKPTGEYQQRLEVQQILADPNATPAQKKAAQQEQTKFELQDRHLRTEINKAQQSLSDNATLKNDGSPTTYTPGGPSVANPRGQSWIDIAAWSMIESPTGSIPSLGYGKEATVAKERVIGRVGELLADLGYTPQDLPAIRGNLKGNISALSKITTLGAQIGQFERTLDKNITVAEKLSDEFKRGNVQPMNALKVAFETGKGDKEALDLAAQLHGIANEWAKIMSGATSAAGVGITEAAQAERYMSAKMASGQLASMFNDVIRPDAANRMAAIKEEKEQLIYGLRNPISTVGTPTNQPPGSPQSPVGASGSLTPEDRKAMDEAFGRSTQQAAPAQSKPNAPAPKTAVPPPAPRANPLGLPLPQ